MSLYLAGPNSSHPANAILWSDYMLYCTENWKLKFNDVIFAIRYDLSGNPAITGNLPCPYCGMSHHYLEFYNPWTMERCFSINGSKEKCIDYSIGEQKLNQESIITPIQYLTSRLGTLLEEHCLKEECTVFHQELTDSVTINEIERLIICPCTSAIITTR